MGGISQSMRQQTCPARSSVAPDRPIRVLAIMEANSVTGPAKNVIGFAANSVTRGGDTRLEISIAAFVRGDERDNPFVAAARSAGVGVDVIHERFVFDLSVIPQLRRIVEARKPDVIQTHAVKSHFLVWLTRLRRRHHWIAFNRGYTSENPKIRVYNQLDRISLRNADRVVSVSEAFARDLQRKGIPRDRIIVRHNMVPPFAACSREQVAELRMHLRIAPDALLLLSVGRLSPEKGHSDLIDAIGELRDMPPTREFNLVIVGEGPQRNAIQRKIGKLGLGKLVTLAGQQPDVNPYYHLADIFVLPSHSEGSPNVLLEAMAAGIPTVATNVGGVPEIAIDGKTSLFVEDKKPGALADALFRLLNDEALRRELGQAAAARAAEYDPENYCDAMVEIHRQLVRNEN
jgi:glycosyltransferase involved in cell wall biosynthesis